MSTATPYPAPPNFLETLLNSGKPLRGVTGYVPAEVKCCSGRTVVYVLVSILETSISGCSFSLKVIGIPGQDTFWSKVEFTVDPEEFYKTLEDVKKHEAYREVCRQYSQAVHPFQYSHSTTLTKKRKLFKTALEECSIELRAEIIEELGEEKDLKTAPDSFLREWYFKMMQEKFKTNEEIDED